MAGGSLPPGLIINADDLGIHPDTNAGILSAYRHGILTSCTMLMTTPYFDETVRDFVRPAVLPIGVHLSLTLGKSAAPQHEVPDLIDQEGNLRLSAGSLVLASFAGDRGQRLIRQIRREFEAQLARAHDFGLRPTHADSHQHIHMNPAIFSVVEELLPRFGIKRIRFCRELFPAFAIGADLPALMKRLNPAKWALLRWRSRQITPHLASNELFFGALYSGTATKRAITALLETIPLDRSFEICIHPGFPAPAGQNYYPRSGYNDFISSPARRLEHDILVDAEIGALVRRRGLDLRSFAGPKI